MNTHEIDRRTFLKTMALVAASSALAPMVTEARSPRKAPLDGFPDLKYNADGKFRIVQFTDTHYIAGDERSPRALNNVREMLDIEKPDLVIHTGDIIFGRPAQQSLKEILSPMGERQIPWAVALGNHDGQFGMSRKEVYDYIRTLPYNINTAQKPGVTGDSNDVITISSPKGKVDRVLYLLDTGDRYYHEGKDMWGSLVMNQVDWYQAQAQTLSMTNGGKRVPALMFQHIPVTEFTTALADKANHVMVGNQTEAVCSPEYNTGVFERIQQPGDVEAMICGHDHDNDYNMRWHGFNFIYGRFSGCDTVYNNLKPNGCRVIELTQGKPGFHTYIRHFGGHTEQEVFVPSDFE